MSVGRLSLSLPQMSSKQSASEQPTEQPQAKRSKTTTSSEDTMSEQKPTLRLGSIAPDFEAKTTQGRSN